MESGLSREGATGRVRMDKRMTRREREKERQRGEMLAAALDLFSERGYHGVSMHEIAKTAEFAIGTVYKFFKSKEELYKALMMETAAEYHGLLKGALSTEGDTLTLVREYVRAKAGVFAKSAATLRLYVAETRGASFNIRAGLDEDIQGLYDKVVEGLASVLERGVEEKVLKKLDPYYMAVALEGLTNAFLFCWLKDPERHPYEKNVAMITELFLRGSQAQ
jgi:AcrR family transcriptional regulator